MSAPGPFVGTVRSFGSLVKLSHSVFALPFALLSLLAATDGRPSLRQLVLVVFAVVAARTAAMAYNRIVDRSIDAANPRTAAREIPRGVVSVAQATWLTGIASALFLTACWLLAPMCLWLGMPTLAWLLGYSHVKRFSALCHLWLGVALGLSPLAAWVAVDGAFGSRLLAPAVLGLGITLWVAGFDILYSCQDESFDRSMGLHSIPVRLGTLGALRCSRLLHMGAAIGFAAFGELVPLGPAFRVGIGLAAALMVWQHALLRPHDLSRIGMAFFTANGMISIALLAAGCLDLYVFRGAR